MQETIRIDKYLSQLQLVSRRDAKKFFRDERVMINGYIERDHWFHVIDGDTITIDDDLEFSVAQSVTVLLNKPVWYVCSELDEWTHKSYKHLLEDCIYAPMLKIAGRLDQDTTGLVIATSDGAFNHRLTSPKSGKEKEYKVTCEKEVPDTDLLRLEKGVSIDDYVTRPAKVVRINTHSFYLTLVEGKYHQVKKMCEAIDNTCIALERIRIAGWNIDDLQPWERKFIDQSDLFDIR